MASPAFRSSTIPGSGSSAGITITKPTGTVDNDILVCFAYVESDVTITPPSGWAQKLLNEQNVTGKEHRLYCWWHRAASDGASYTWSWTGSVFRDFSVHAFSGALTSGDPFQQTDASINTGAASATTPAVSVTTTTADTTLLWAGSNFDSNSWDTDPSGFTALYDASYARCFYKAQAAAGSSGSITCNNTTSSNQTAMLLSLASIAASGGTTTTKTMTDTTTISDAALDPTYRVRQMSDAIVATDAPVYWRRLVRVTDETTTLVDSVVKSVITAGATVYTKVMTDTLGATDAVIQWLRRVRNQIETITISEGNLFRTAIVTADESIDLSDGFVTWRRLKRVMDENLDIIDGFSKILSGAGITYAKVMSDTVTLIDDAGRRWRLRFTQLTDAVGLSDQVLDSLRAVRSLGDVVELSDGTVKVRQTIKSMDESIEVSDERISTLYLDQISNTSFTFGASGPPFRFGGD